MTNEELARLGRLRNQDPGDLEMGGPGFAQLAQAKPPNPAGMVQISDTVQTGQGRPDAIRQIANALMRRSMMGAVGANLEVDK